MIIACSHTCTSTAVAAGWPPAACCALITRTRRDGKSCIGAPPLVLGGRTSHSAARPPEGFQVGSSLHATRNEDQA